MGNKQRKLITREHLWKLWEFIGVDRWRALLKEYKPNNNFLPAGQGTLKGLCVHPDHQDTSPSFYIYVGKGFAKCYGGSCNYYDSNPLRLISYILGLSYAEALEYVQQKYKPPFLPKKALEELEAQRLNQELKHEIFAAAHQAMCNAIGDPSNTEYAYAKKSLHWLINTRKIEKANLHALPVAVMPDIATLGRVIHERYNVAHKQWERAGNPAVAEPSKHYEDVNNYLADHVRSPLFAGGILFPLHSTPHEIGNFKLRSPDSSKDFLIMRDEYEEHLGMYGLGWNRYRPFWKQGKTQSFVHILEGEFDALSLMSRYVSSATVEFPAISAGGRGGAHSIERCMRMSGINKVYLVGDAPDATGDDVVQQWMEQLRDTEISIFAGWDNLPGTKDMDEVVNKHGLDKVAKHFWEDRNDTFIKPWSWAVQRASVEIDGIPEQDFRNRMEVAANHGKYLNHRLECAKFIETMESVYNLNQSLLKREVTAREGTELGFIQNIIDALKEFLFIVGTRDINGAKHLVTYDTKNKRFVTLQLASIKAINQQLAPIVGSLIRFIEDYVGRPPFLEFPDMNTEGRVVPKLIKQLGEYITTAVLDMTQGAPDFMTATRYRQGYHCVRNSESNIDEYIVCGSDVFEILREGDTQQYRQLEGPAIHSKNTIFDVGLVDSATTDPWYPGGLTTSFLEEGKKVNLRQLYDDLVLVFDKGFRFKNHTITTELLAALMLSYPIMDALDRPVMVFITGDTNSGKSSLLSIFTGTGYKGAQLLYCSQGHEDYTAAGIAGFADSDTKLLALDEFESGDDDKGTHVNRIFEMFRGLVSGQANRVRGRADGTAFRQTFRLPVIFSAIKTAERPQDLNRMLTIEMQKIPDKTKPVEVLLETIGKDRIKEMGEEITVGMYPEALELARIEREISTEYSVLKKQRPEMAMEWRLASSLFPVLAVLHMIGRDWKDFMVRYVTEHEYDLKQTAVASETQGFLKAIMRNPCIPQADGPNVTISQLLVSAEQRDDINASNKGIYFDEKTKSLLILTDQGTGMIPFHLRGKMTGSHLKNLLERHPAAYAPATIEESGILHRVGKYLGAGIQLEDVVVLDAEPWLSANSEEFDAEAQDAIEDNQEEKPDVNKPAEKAAEDYEDWGDEIA